MPRVAILVGPKSAGSNMRALVQAMMNGAIEAEPLVFVPSESAPAYVLAKTLNAKTIIANPDDPSYCENLIAELINNEIDWICLAGYIRLLPEPVVKQFGGRILNIHPALLPKFGGKGMYGMRVHEAVIAAGEHESGCTVHFVTSHYDEGEIILQTRCEISPHESEESLAKKVLALELETYPEALKRVMAHG